MKCGVIIPTWRRADVLRQTLDALGSQTDSRFDAIVVSDGEDAPTRDLAESYKPGYALKWVFHPENRGLAAARNTGARASDAEILVFLDDDTLAEPGWIHGHIEGHSKTGGEDTAATIGGNPGGVVYGRTVYRYLHPARNHTERYLRDIRERGFEQFAAAVSGQRLEFGKMAAFGLNASIRRTAFIEIGGFDEKLRYVDEESELGARLYERGFRFEFAPEAVAVHYDRKDLTEYHREILRRAGRDDLYRRRAKNQWNARIQLLGQMHGENAAKRLAHRIAWHAPRFFEGGEKVCRWATDLTGSQTAFRLWTRFGAGEYWRGIRADGETLDSLRELRPRRAPILMFHSIAEPEERRLWSYYLRPQRFARFIEWLKAAGYHSVLPEEWSSGECPKRSVILTFDDAYDDFYSEAMPALERWGFRALVFLVADRIGETNIWDSAKGWPQRRLLQLEQIRDLQRRGVQFGSHTLTHPFLPELDDQELERELRGSKEKLEELLGSEVSSIAYPWGGVDGRVRAATARAGYKFGMTTQDGLNGWDDPLALKRVNVAEVDNLAWFRLKIATGKDWRQRVRERVRKE